MEILESLGKSQKEARTGQEEARRSHEEARRGPEEARRGPEEARKRPGRGQKRPGRVRNIRKKAPKGQESRIGRKTARNAILYEQKMTSLGALTFGDFAESRKRPKKEEARKRPRRGPEEARKRPEEARKRPEEARKRPGEAPKARNPEFGEKLLETQCFMNKK